MRECSMRLCISFNHFFFWRLVLSQLGLLPVLMFFVIINSFPSTGPRSKPQVFGQKLAVPISGEF